MFTIRNLNSIRFATSCNVTFKLLCPSPSFVRVIFGYGRSCSSIRLGVINELEGAEDDLDKRSSLHINIGQTTRY
jgi:hypothetical protein